MRKVRTIKALCDYLQKIDCPIGRTTISKLIKENEIPHMRISGRVIIFDLDEVDAWLGGNI
ncbi:helix-turn-helix transcriptional regulator [Rummeliibacillus stabekisii]|uniref:Helix-turn-helix domain-containing protein n=1 Tax=Rummeliibacillus stabekisii TaxID=241244 RepID=A0A143H9L6_9BACL|nr:helix-turn-helix domain-containing protein [Rummeliibacillus stabekisii]AMW98412.1 hypothetical protein ATY39_02580 [Rummeliibacillus stabekisii]